MAVDNHKITAERAPKIELLPEAPPKQEFFTEAEFYRLLDALPDYIKPVAIFGFKRGGRIAEYLNLKWDDNRLL